MQQGSASKATTIRNPKACGAPLLREVHDERPHSHKSIETETPLQIRKASKNRSEGLRASASPPRSPCHSLYSVPQQRLGMQDIQGPTVGTSLRACREGLRVDQHPASTRQADCEQDMPFNTQFLGPARGQDGPGRHAPGQRLQPRKNKKSSVTKGKSASVTSDRNSGITSLLLPPLGA